MRRLISGVAVAIALAATPASAQQPELSKWDAGASFGLMWGDGLQDRTQYFDDTRIAYHLEVGRFLSTHLKTDAAVILTSKTQSYDYASFAVPGVPSAYSFTQHDRQVTGYSGGLTYQFFENQMMHPFVTGGVQVATAADHRYRSATTYTLNRQTYTVPGLDQRSTDVLIRPFVAVGAKSYFNERTFIKSELALAARNTGFSHAILRLGFGVDF